jgi:hypothetical protein
MRSSSASLLGSGVAAALVLTASTVFAHIDLISPVSRYVVNRANGGGGSKECPCGGPESMIDGDRVCNNQPTDQTHDPNRSTKVTKFEAGSTITIQLVEYINHSGRFRVAFDPDGADMTDFNSNILLDVPDDSTKVGATNNPPYEFEVTLPTTTCDNCTLQVIQDMNGNTTTPVKDPSGDSTYYTCADIQLVAPGTLGMDDGNTDPTDTPAPPNTGMGTAGTTGMGTGGTTGMTGGTMGVTGTGGMGTNLGTVPMTGDATKPTTTPTAMTGTGTTSSAPSTGVGSLTPAIGTSMGNTSTSTPMAATPNSSDDSGGCSLSNLGARTPASPFAALAVAGMATSLAARRRQRRQK